MALHDGQRPLWDSPHEHGAVRKIRSATRRRIATTAAFGGRRAAERRLREALTAHKTKIESTSAASEY